MEPQKTPLTPSDNTNLDKPASEPLEPAKPSDALPDVLPNESPSEGSVPTSQTPTVPSAPALPPDEDSSAEEPTVSKTPEAAPSVLPSQSPSTPPFQTPVDDAPAASPVMGGPSMAPAGDLPVLPLNESPSTMPIIPARPRRKKGLILGGIIAAAVAVLGTSAAAAYYYVTVNKPENVLLQALGNSLDEKKAETMHVSGHLNFSQPESDMEFTSSYKAALHNTTGAMDLSAEADLFVAKTTLDVRSTDGKSLYVKVGGLSGLPELLGAFATEGSEAEVYSSLIDGINNQWFEINESLIKQALGSPLTQEVSTEQRKKIGELYQKNAFLVIKQKLADEKINDVSSHHFKVVIDKAKMRAFMVDLGKLGIDSYKMTDEELKNFDDMLKSFTPDKYPIDIWIAKDSKMFSKFAFSTTQDDMTVTFTAVVDSYNKPVKVEKPADAKSILEVVGDFMNALSSSNPELLMPGLEGLDSGVSL